MRLPSFFPSSAGKEHEREARTRLSRNFQLHLLFSDSRQHHYISPTSPPFHHYFICCIPTGSALTRSSLYTHLEIQQKASLACCVRSDLPHVLVPEPLPSTSSFRTTIQAEGLEFRSRLPNHT